MAENKIDELMLIGIDIGKDTFHIVAFGSKGQLVMRKQIKRWALLNNLEDCTRCAETAI